MNKKYKQVAKDIMDYVLSLFFPKRCVFCDKVIGPYDDICPDCEKNLPWIDGEICHFCGCKKSDCTCKKRHGHFYEEVISPLYFRDNVRKSIHKFKFRDEPQFSKVYAVLMNDIRLREYADVTFDYVTYIPMNEKQEKRRGYNQGRLLAREISNISDISFGDNLLVKLYETETQHGCKNWSQRKGNLFGVFDVNPEIDVSGKTILLVDDVKTTGSTLNECSKMLYLNGADSVYCLTTSLAHNLKIKNDSKKNNNLKEEGDKCSEQK